MGVEGEDGEEADPVQLIKHIDMKDTTIIANSIQCLLAHRFLLQHILSGRILSGSKQQSGGLHPSVISFLYTVLQAQLRLTLR